eukprot:5841527-Pleurochrysis_carterae.AAC.3
MFSARRVSGIFKVDDVSMIQRPNNNHKKDSQAPASLKSNREYLVRVRKWDMFSRIHREGRKGSAQVARLKSRMDKTIDR